MGLKHELNNFSGLLIFLSKTLALLRNQIGGICLCIQGSWGEGRRGWGMAEDKALKSIKKKEHIKTKACWGPAL